MEKVYHYTVIFEKEDIGYHVYCPALVGCHSQGDTYEEALENIKEAIELYLESLIEDYVTVPEEDVIMKPIKVAA